MTKNDKSWIKDEFVVNNVRLRTEMAQVKDELKEEIRSKHDEMMTALDKIMGETVKGGEQVFA